jgi:hypothetical protein
MTSSAAAIESCHVHSSSSFGRAVWPASDQVQRVEYLESEVETDIATSKVEMDTTALELEMDASTIKLETEIDVNMKISKQEQYSAD